VARCETWKIKDLAEEPKPPHVFKAKREDPPPFCLTHVVIHMHLVGFGLVAVLQGMLHEQGMLCQPGWLGAHELHCDVLAL